MRLYENLLAELQEELKKADHFKRVGDEENYMIHSGICIGLQRALALDTMERFGYGKKYQGAVKPLFPFITIKNF